MQRDINSMVTTNVSNPQHDRVQITRGSCQRRVGFNSWDSLRYGTDGAENAKVHLCLVFHRPSHRIYCAVYGQVVDDDAMEKPRASESVADPK